MKKSRYKEITVNNYDEKYAISFKERTFTDCKWLSREELEKLSKDIILVLEGKDPYAM